MGYGTACELGTRLPSMWSHHQKKAWDYIEQADKLCSLDLHTAEEIDKSFLLGKAMKSEKIEDWDRLLLCYSLLGKYRK